MKKFKIAIISSSFRKEVSDNLEKNCLATLANKGIEKSRIDIFRVPGSWEIPLVAKILAKKGVYSVIIVFGAIVKGDTYHFEQISTECARGCMRVSLQYEIPVVFGVLSVYDIKDAIERATNRKENKGVEAAETALEMIKLLSRI